MCLSKLINATKGTMEIALMADSVPAKDVYKVLRSLSGVERAFAKMDEIKENVIW